MIAIIDDDTAVREATSALLRSMGYVTELFSSAAEFLRSAQKNEAECIISDVKMPGMTGVALQEQLIAEQQKTPMIFVTGHPEEDELLRRARSCGAHGVLIKPYSQQHLLA